MLMYWFQWLAGPEIARPPSLNVPPACQSNVSGPSPALGKASRRSRGFRVLLRPEQIIVAALDSPTSPLREPNGIPTRITEAGPSMSFYLR